jgi:hypothetical protein
MGSRPSGRSGAEIEKGTCKASSARSKGGNIERGEVIKIAISS